MEDNKMKIFNVAFVIIVIALAGGYLWITNSDATGAATVGEDGFVELSTTIQNFQYGPDTFTVEEGAKVRLTIINKDNVLHGLHLPQFGLVDGTPGGATKTYQFVAVENPTNGQAQPSCSQEHGETLTFNVI